MKGHRLLYFGWMLCGILLSALGMALYYRSMLGSDPVSVFIDGLHCSFSLSYGTVLNTFNAVVLVLVFVVARSEVRIGLVFSLLFSGTLLDGWTALLQRIPFEGSLLSKLGYFCLGIVSLALGTALFLESKLGAGPWDTILVYISKKSKLPFRYVRCASDATFALVGFLLKGVVGVGTVASILTVGVLIDCFRGAIRRLFGTK